MDPRSYWEKVYQTKQPDEVSWYRAHLDLSLALIEEATPNHDAQIIDIGGGESTLVDDLLVRDYHHVAVLDLSATALNVAKARLGAAAGRVDWFCGDVTKFEFSPHRYDVWHDRAVFHFLTQAKDRIAYVRQVAQAVKPGGHVIIATFGPEGPATCSGLNIVRYDPDSLHDEFGPRFQLLKHRTELHETPAGVIQQFVYCYCAVDI